MYAEQKLIRINEEDGEKQTFAFVDKVKLKRQCASAPNPNQTDGPWTHGPSLVRYQEPFSSSMCKRLSTHFHFY